MPDLSKRSAAKERARRRRELLRTAPPRNCEDCGATIPRSTDGFDPVRCSPCMEARNGTIRQRAGFRPDGCAA